VRRRRGEVAGTCRLRCAVSVTWSCSLGGHSGLSMEANIAALIRPCGVEHEGSRVHVPGE
jgi:hypothetical protein